jgi:S1-C subfamily serine protease
VDVFRIGFQNFDMSSFGVESDRLKAIAGQPQMLVLAFAAGGAHSKTITWESVKVKNLETLGERSATGMDSERGVYVVSIEAYGSELRDFLKANDVILGFAGKAVNSLSDLHSAVAGADLTQPQQMTIYRNQKENVITIPGGVIRSVVNLGK